MLQIDHGRSVDAGCAPVDDAGHPFLAMVQQDVVTPVVTVRPRLDARSSRERLPQRLGKPVHGRAGTTPTEDRPQLLEGPQRGLHPALEEPGVDDAGYRGAPVQCGDRGGSQVEYVR